MATPKKNVKQVLRDECLPVLGRQYKYFHHRNVGEWLMQRKLSCSPGTLNRYVHDFVRLGVIHSSGRGWYSTLGVPFTLDTEPVSEAVAAVARQFPLLDFCCWSTAQVNPWMHHLLGRFVVFVFTDRDAMDTVYHRLQDMGWQAWINPTRQEAAKTFVPGDKAVVIRPSIQREPVRGKYATIEKILVDLVMENRALNIMDPGEFQGMAGRLAGSARINIGVLASYAERRKISLDKVFAKNKYIIPT